MTQFRLLPFSVTLMSDFEIHILTVFLIPQCSQGHNEENETLSSPIGLQVPSGLILENFQFLKYFLSCLGWADPKKVVYLL